MALVFHLSRKLTLSSPVFSSLYYLVGGPAKGFLAKTMSSAIGHGSQDGGFEKDRIVKAPGDPSRKEFTYFMLGGGRFIYASVARLALIKVRAQCTCHFH